MQKLYEISQDKHFTQAFLSALPVGVLIIQDAKWIVAANNVIQKALGLAADDLIGKAVGQALGCVHSLTSQKGVRQPLLCPNCENEEACRSIDNCISCEIKNIVIAALEKNQPMGDLVRMNLILNGQVRDITLKVQAVPYPYEKKRLTAIILDDISTLKEPSLSADRDEFLGIITRDPQMLRIIDTIQHVATTNLSILIMGESGTGKELAALAIHKSSNYRKGHFVPFNCGALPEGVAESELFGHVKGAFTGAHRDKKGRFELAHQGTLFMDEVAELTPTLQVKLLRVLQDLKFEKVGGETTIRADTRIIAATNKELGKETAAGRFREDLFYRLSVVPINLPPLRARHGDIPLLTDYFLDRYGREIFGRPLNISDDAEQALSAYHWPGNIRELQNAIKFSLIHSNGQRIAMKDLPAHIQPRNPQSSVSVQQKLSLQLSDIDHALEKTGGNKRQAARLLGISRSTLYRYLRNRN